MMFTFCLWFLNKIISGFFIFIFVSLLRYTVTHSKYLFLNRPILLVSVLLKWVSSVAPGKLDQKLDLSFFLVPLNLVYQNTVE